MDEQGMVNVGQLIREQYQDEGVYVIGYGTYEGTVVASDAWGSATMSMDVPEAVQGSWEALLHDIDGKDKIVLMDRLRSEKELRRPLGHRAIGVVYNPSQEQGNYVPSVLPERYDAFVFIDKTEALKPLQAPEHSKARIQKRVSLITGMMDY
jgi:erythromycin esterase